MTASASSAGGARTGSRSRSSLVSSWWQDRKADVFGAAVLFMLLTATLGPFVFGDRTLEDSVVIPSNYASGSTPQAFAGLQLSREVDEGAPAWELEPQLILNRHLLFDKHEPPIWNPFSGYGTPLAADMQSQPYNPTAWIAMLLPGARGYDIFIMLRLYLAGLFTFLFLRQFFGLAPSLFGGAAFMYTGYLWIYLTMPEVSVEMLVPAMLLASERIVRAPGPRTAAFFALICAWIVIGGMPESMILALAFGGVYLVTRALAIERDARAWRTLAVWLGVGSVVGVCLAGIQWLPFLEFLGLSFNQHSLAQYAPGSEQDALDSGSLAGYLTPLLSGPPWNNIFSGFAGHFDCRGFCGTVVAYFAVLGAFSSARLRFRRTGADFPGLLFAFVALFMIAKRFGAPEVNWIGALPGFRYVEFPKYGEAVLACSLAVVAAYGVDLVMHRKVLLYEILGAGVAILSIFTATAGQEKAAYLALTEHGDFYIQSLLGGLASVTCCAAIALSRTIGALSMRLSGAAALAAVVVELNAGYILPMFYVVTNPAPQTLSTYAQNVPYLRYLQDHAGSERVYAEDALLFPNWSAAYGLLDVRALNALYYERYLPFVQKFFFVHHDSDLDDRFLGTVAAPFTDAIQQRFLRISSIRYVATNHPIGKSIISDLMERNRSQYGPKFRDGTFTIGGVSKDGLFVHPPRSYVGTDVVVPRNASSLIFSIGMQPDVWQGAVCGDGVTFSVKLSAGTVTRVFRRYIDPKHRVEERKWLDERLDARPFRGKPAKVAVSTSVGPSGSECADWALIGDMHFDAEDHGSPEPLSVAYEDPNATVYRVSNILPRLAGYARASAVQTPDQALAEVGDVAFDIDHTAVLEADHPPLDVLRASRRADVVAGTIDSYDATKVTGTIRLDQPSVVVLNDTFFPGWDATVDGEPTSVFHADYLFRGIIVPAGTHKIAFLYAPPSYEIGKVLTLSGLFFILILLIAPALARATIRNRRVP